MPGNQSRLFDLAVPILRRIEPRNPGKGLSLVAIAQKPDVTEVKSAADV
jgi:hypothetical protein